MIYTVVSFSSQIHFSALYFSRLGPGLGWIWALILFRFILLMGLFGSLCLVILEIMVVSYWVDWTTVLYLSCVFLVIQCRAVGADHFSVQAPVAYCGGGGEGFYRLMRIPRLMNRGVGVGQPAVPCDRVDEIGLPINQLLQIGTALVVVTLLSMHYPHLKQPQGWILFL